MGPCAPSFKQYNIAQPIKRTKEEFLETVIIESNEFTKDFTDRLREQFTNKNHVITEEVINEISHWLRKFIGENNSKYISCI